ncbi:hypothetical protein RHMOL_Rhmol05G0316200 [Rhododendron molle]|uniref:Uncharacterized protein n=1 Tax=Rhododendron molle TaxID=49168 RepID=A0ACC0NV47_RHOML|nr:hypothetical protein RHMOL_Rhmol05G0316200 [Rhododendron molle]
MAQSSNPRVGNPVAIVSPQFCAPNPVVLTIVTKLLSITEGDFTVTDVNGNVMFKIKGKILTAHKRWQVYRGDSTDAKDLLFSANKSSLIQFKTQLDVFLAANTKEDVCDFKIKGSRFERSCTIYLGVTSTIIAQPGVSGGVEQDVTTVEGEKPAFDPEHDIAVDVGGGEVTVVYGEEFARDG